MKLPFPFRRRMIPARVKEEKYREDSTIWHDDLASGNLSFIIRHFALKLKSNHGNWNISESLKVSELSASPDECFSSWAVEKYEHAQVGRFKKKR